MESFTVTDFSEKSKSTLESSDQIQSIVDGFCGRLRSKYNEAQGGLEEIEIEDEYKSHYLVVAITVDVELGKYERATYTTPGYQNINGVRVHFDEVSIFDSEGDHVELSEDQIDQIKSVVINFYS